MLRDLSEQTLNHMQRDRERRDFDFPDQLTVLFSPCQLREVWTVASVCLKSPVTPAHQVGFLPTQCGDLDVKLLG